MKKKTVLTLTNIDAFVGGSIDNGLFYFAGKLAPNITMQQAEKGIDTEIEKLKQLPQKIKKTTRESCAV